MPQPKNEFEALKKLWYDKLKKSGFNDVEQDEDYLKASSWPLRKNGASNQVRFVSGQEYFRLAGQFLHDYKFKDEIEELIWRLHSEGKFLREISQELKNNRVKLNKDSVNARIKKLKKIMLDQCYKKQTW